MNGCAVTIVFPDAGVGAKLFPTELARFVNEYYESHGVDVLAGRKVESISRDGDTSVVTTDDGAIEADVVVAVIVPRTDLAEQAGVEVDDGVLVDDRGRAGGRDDVFAAGDVARFPVSALGGTRRVEHETTRTPTDATSAPTWPAPTPGRPSPVLLLRSLRPRLRGRRDVDSRLETVAEWAEPNRKGVVCYVEDGGPRGSCSGTSGIASMPRESSFAPASPSPPTRSAR